MKLMRLRKLLHSCIVYPSGMTLVRLFFILMIHGLSTFLRMKSEGMAILNVTSHSMAMEDRCARFAFQLTRDVDSTVA